MEIPCGNFFEVTINSNKLYSFILEINKQIQSQELKTEDIAKSVAAISTTLAHKLKKLSEEAEIELEKIRKSNQEENNYLRLYMKDADKKTGEKLDELENTIIMMSKRVCKVKEELQEDLSIKLSYLEKKIANNPALAEVERGFNQEIKKLQAHLESIQQRQDKIDHTIENDLKKTVQFNEDMLEKNKISETQHKNESHKLLSLGNSFREGVTSRSRKRLKTHRVGTLFENSEDMSNIVLKIEEFEHRLQQTDPGRGTLCQSKVVRTTENIIKIGSKNNLAASQREIKQRQFEQLITSKLQKIEEIAHRRVLELQKELGKNANKHEIVDEHISILSRKIEKEKARIHELTQSIKRFEEKKIDERVIDGLKTAIKKISKEIEEGLDLKLNRETYEKEKSRVNQRIFFLSEMVTQKAEKSEVKKGFTFFQEKIKEIIIVLAEQRNSVKDGAGKRMPFKCLSCDKELEITAEPNCRLSHNYSSNSRNSIRCSTNQIRKRIRVMNNSLIPSED